MWNKKSITTHKCAANVIRLHLVQISSFGSFNYSLYSTMSKWEDVDCSWAPPIIEELVGPRGYGKCAVLVKRPAKEITNDCFEIQTRPVPDTLAEGDVLVQQLLLSMDPTHSMWMRKITQYSPCVAIGNVMRCSGKISDLFTFLCSISIYL